MRGAGQSMQVVLESTELIRRRIKGLYSNIEITTVDVPNRPDPIVMLKATVSLQRLDVYSPGY